ncbi:hypothetical protein [Flagellimonas halotolerans]|uniref:UspA domain-containing protein n=2 Tax=Flagellimonas halotolerans TaxID=3112164 RepID=A0ABU6IRR3_9FLAO|nr:hypothetical protein [Muricauda sp. SYSU M84420]MEC3965845.1 hypothetical protein [Muricauda sp. SYSU M86414]MEC4265689.1 hypothetical protein [Muricauda sp. SYSU M84420]
MAYKLAYFGAIKSIVVGLDGSAEALNIFRLISMGFKQVIACKYICKFLLAQIVFGKKQEICTQEWSDLKHTFTPIIEMKETAPRT